MKEIFLAGGCFWGVEGYFDQIEGVTHTTVGYANGNSGETAYELLKLTDHAETIQIEYNPEVVDLKTILKHYFRIIDPFSVNKQGNDIGRQYRTGIYYNNEDDVQVAQEMMKEVSKANAGRELAVELEPLKHFIVAEDYHQDYLKKNPNGYCHIDLNLAKKPLA